MAEQSTLKAGDIALIAQRRPGDHVVLTLALECQGVGAGQFRLPTRHLVDIGFLPGWSRQNYRTAIGSAVATGLMGTRRNWRRRSCRIALPSTSRNWLAIGPMSGRAA